MKKISFEREVTIIFLVLGTVAGIIAWSLKNLLFSIPSSILIYSAGFYAVYKIFKENKPQPLFMNSVVTYFFLLMIVWIVLLSTYR